MHTLKSGIVIKYKNKGEFAIWLNKNRFSESSVYSRAGIKFETKGNATLRRTR